MMKTEINLTDQPMRSQEVGSLLGKTKRWVDRNRVSMDPIPCSWIDKRTPVYLRSDVLSWISKRRILK